MWPTQALPLLEGHHLHRFLERSHVCLLLQVISQWPAVMEALLLVVLAVTDREVPSGGSKQTHMSCSDRLCFYRGQSREESNKQRHTPHPSEQLWTEGCFCVFVCQLFTGSNQILLSWLSHWFSHPLVMMVLRSRTHSHRIQAWSFMRAAHHVEHINDTWRTIHTNRDTNHTQTLTLATSWLPLVLITLKSTTTFCTFCTPDLWPHLSVLHCPL